jgi:hypothetical protein
LVVGLSKLVFEALGALVMLAILVFIFGGFIGLLIIGWERLIEVVMPLAEKYLTTITLLCLYKPTKLDF